MGAEGYGVYSYAIALITLLAVPTKLGLPLIVVRFISSYFVKREWSLLSGLLKRVNQSVLLLSLIVISCSLIILFLFFSHVGKDFIRTFLWALVLLPLLSLGAIRSAALRGLNHVILGQIPEYFVQPLLFLILIVITGLLFPYILISPALSMAFQVVAALIAFILGTLWLINKIPNSAKEADYEYDTKLWIKTAIPLFMVGGAMIINKKTDILLLGVFQSAEEVGIYNVIVAGATLVVFSVSAFDAVLAPIFSKLYTIGDIKQLQKIVTYSAWGILLFSIPVALILILFSDWILETFYGEDFVRGSTALIILCIGQISNSARGPAGILLNMSGNEKYTAISVAIAAVVNVIANLILIPIWGIEGAAIGTVISMILWNLLLIYWSKKLLNITTYIHFKR